MLSEVVKANRAEARVRNKAIRIRQAHYDYRDEHDKHKGLAWDALAADQQAYWIALAKAA